jgi:uncharacterized protein YecT (DUF1311 family)
MKKVLLVAIGCAVAAPAFAQYAGPAVETCRAYAKREIARGGTRAKDVVLEKETLSMERYTRKMGNQFVSSILTGNGAVVLDGSPSAELSFICLLADDKRAVFFEWLPRPHASALAQCTRDEELRAKPRSCLETLLQVAENDLTHAYASRFQDARERDHGTGKEASVDVFRRANEEWRQYRDAECSRRRETVPQGVAADDYQIACMVELTRRRALDMR